MAWALACAWGGLILWQTWERFPLPSRPFSLLLDFHRFGAVSIMTLVSRWGETLLRLGGVGLYLLAAFGPGEFVVRRLVPADRSRLDQVLLALGAGFSLLSLALFGLGVLGGFHPVALLLAILVPAFWGAVSLWTQRARLRPSPGWLLGSSAQWTDRVLAGLALLAAGWILLNANVPEVFYDSLVYHLAVPAAWLRQGGLTDVPYNFFSHLPMGLELLYVPALQWGDERLCRLLHAALALLGGLTVFALGRRWVGRRAGLWAAGLYLAVPVVIMNAMIAGVDAGAVFFAALALGRILEWGLGPAPAIAEWALAGWLTGAAAAVKYNTVFMLGSVVAAVWLFGRGRTLPWRAQLARLAMFGGLALVPLLPWLVKNTMQTGNPVYPFLYRVFPSRQIDPAKMQQQMDGFKEYGERSLLQYLRHPWDLSFYYPTSNSYLGTVLLFLLPGMIGLAAGWRRGPPVARILLGAATLGWLLWSWQTQIMRYLMPLLPVLMMLVALVLRRVDEHLPRPWPGAVRIAVLLLAGWGLLNTWSIGLYNLDPVGAALGWETREDYLNRKLMNNYIPIARAADREPGPVKILVMGESRTYYFHRPVMASTVYDPNPFIATLAQGPDAEAVWRAWRAQGLTHLFIHPQEAARTRGYEPYHWDAGAIARMQELLSRYAEPVAEFHREWLWRLRDAPADRPVKTGRFLFTYDPATVARVLNFHQRAALALSRGRDEDARAEWMQALAMAPDWAEGYLGLGWLMQRRGRIHEAMDAYRRADQLGWLDAAALNNYGVLLMNHGEPGEAASVLRRALQLQPGLAEVRKNLERLEAAPSSH